MSANGTISEPKSQIPSAADWNEPQNDLRPLQRQGVFPGKESPDDAYGEGYMEEETPE